MFPSVSPGISIKIIGVLPGLSFVINSASSGMCFFAHSVAIISTLSMCPFLFQSGSKDGDLFGILMYSISVGTILSSQNLLIEVSSSFLLRFIFLPYLYIQHHFSLQTLHFLKLIYLLEAHHLQQ